MGWICFPLTLHIPLSRRPQIKEVSVQTARILMLERRMSGAKSERAEVIYLRVESKQKTKTGRNWCLYVSVPDECPRCGHSRHPPRSDGCLHPIWTWRPVFTIRTCATVSVHVTKQIQHIFTVCFRPFKLTKKGFWASNRIPSGWREKLVQVPDWINITFRD